MPRSIRDTPVVAAGGEGMVPLLGEMGTHPLEHGRGDDRRNQRAGFRRDAGQGLRRRVEHRQAVGLVAGEGLDPVGEGTILVLALQKDDADARLHQFQRAMEEVGGVDWPGADPLHLLEDAHAVIEGLRPHRSSRGDDVPVRLPDLLGEGLGRGGKAALHGQQRFGQAR